MKLVLVVLVLLSGVVFGQSKPLCANYRRDNPGFTGELLNTYREDGRPVLACAVFMFADTTPLEGQLILGRFMRSFDTLATVDGGLRDALLAHFGEPTPNIVAVRDANGYIYTIVEAYTPETYFIIVY